MDNILKSGISRLKDDYAAIVSLILSGLGAGGLIVYAFLVNRSMQSQDYLAFFLTSFFQGLLYALPALTLTAYIEDCYKTKRHTLWFLILAGVSAAAQLGVIALNWEEFTLGFASDTMHLLYTVSMVLLVLLPPLALVSMLTRLNTALMRLLGLLTAVALGLYLITAVLSASVLLVLLSVSYILYTLALIIAVPKIVAFEREHGHYIHHLSEE